MIRICRKYSLAIVTTLFWAATTFVPGPAVSDTRPPDRETVGHYLAGDGAKQTMDGPKAKRGLRRHVLSLNNDGRGVQASTSVLIKPLRTDQFYVAFAAGSPKMKSKQPLSAPPVSAYRSQMQESDFQMSDQDNQQNSMADWVVVADLQGSESPLPAIANYNPVEGSNMAGQNHWYSMLELIFLPADQWTVRAILSMDQDPSTLQPSFSALMPKPSRMGMAIHVDYQIVKRLVLGLDFSHYTYGRTSSSTKVDVQHSNTSHPNDDLFESQAVSAHLTIHF